jgi:serine O-acetyltransferase
MRQKSVQTIQNNITAERSTEFYDPNNLVREVNDLFSREPSVGRVMPIINGPIDTVSDLLSWVLGNAVPIAGERTAIRDICASVFETDSVATDAALTDLQVTTGHNLEPGGQAATLLFSRGIHIMLGHRVSHSLWQNGRHDLSLACKTIFGRAFSTDIHPAARFGKGIWLDHGLGFVVGETAVIDDSVSIWQGVTLGSTLKDVSNSRHPRIRRGVTIGAGAIVLGDIEVGEFSVIAAGAVVLRDVTAYSTVAGVPAQEKIRNSSSFAGFVRPQTGRQSDE